MAQGINLDDLVALSEEELKAELTIRGLPAEGIREVLREPLFFSGRLPGNDTSEGTNLVTVDPIQTGQGAGQRVGPANHDIHNPPRHHSSPVTDGRGPRSRNSGVPAYDILRKWDLKLSGAPGDEVDAFIARIEDRRRLVRITDTDLLDCIPLFLSGLAYHWYKIERGKWITWKACTEATLRHFGNPDLQWTLREEIRKRTQGNDEPIATFLTCMRNLFVQAVPCIDEEEQLNIVHRNKFPRSQVAILRSEFFSMEGLETMASRIERSYRAAADFHPPLRPEKCLLPEFAYHPPGQPSRRQVSFGGVHTIADVPGSGESDREESGSSEARLAALEAALAAFTGGWPGSHTVPTTAGRGESLSASGRPATPTRPTLTANNAAPLLPTS